jgi:hypothetical protein
MDFCSVPPQKATVLEDNCMNYNFARLYISQLYVKVQGVQKNNQVWNARQYGISSGKKWKLVTVVAEISGVCSRV